MKYFTATLLSAITAVSFAASAGAQNKEKTGPSSKTTVGSKSETSGQYWWNAPDAVENAQGNMGTMVTGIGEPNRDSGTGAASGEEGSSASAPGQRKMEADGPTKPQAGDQ